MTYREIAAMVKEVGVPTAYDHFKGTGQKLPFLCFLFPNDSDFLADNQNYADIDILQIELYTEQKDFDLEQKVKDILKAHNLVYSSEEGYLDDEQMYMHTYTMGVVINAES